MLGGRATLVTHRETKLNGNYSYESYNKAKNKGVVQTSKARKNIIRATKKAETMPREL